MTDANENAKIKSDETIKGNRLEIKTQEGGKIDLKELYTKAISCGEVTLAGTAKVQEVMVNTGGKAYNKNLNTTETTVVVNAGADVKASVKVKVKVRAGGSIYIYGNPKEADHDKVFGRKIEVLD